MNITTEPVAGGANIEAVRVDGEFVGSIGHSSISTDWLAVSGKMTDGEVQWGETKVFPAKDEATAWLAATAYVDGETATQMVELAKTTLAEAAKRT